MNVEHLELGETLSKVSGEYKQYLRYNGGRLTLRTNPMHLENLTVIERQDSKSVCIPVDSWMSEQLTTVQNFMEKNVTIPADVEGRAGVAAFKPLVMLTSLFIMVSKFCQYLFYDEALKSFTVFSPTKYALGKGLYVFTIDLPYVYMGKHKYGYCGSLSMMISQVEYTPEVLPLQSINLSPCVIMPPTTPTTTNTTEAKGPTKQRVRKNKSDLKHILPKYSLGRD